VRRKGKARKTSRSVSLSESNSNAPLTSIPRAQAELRLDWWPRQKKNAVEYSENPRQRHSRHRVQATKLPVRSVREMGEKIRVRQEGPVTSPEQQTRTKPHPQPGKLKHQKRPQREKQFSRVKPSTKHRVHQHRKNAGGGGGKEGGGEHWAQAYKEWKNPAIPSCSARPKKERPKQR